MKKINILTVILVLVFIRTPIAQNNGVDIASFARDEFGRLIVEDPHVDKLLDIPDGKMVVIEEYTVQEGDWLSKIAAREYHDPELWKELIFRYNKALRDPHLIYPGDELMLPKIVEKVKPVEQPQEPEKAEKGQDLEYAKSFMEDAVMIANFESRGETNVFGGKFAPWDKDPRDVTQSCELEFSEDVREGETGYSLKLIYDVDSPRPAFNGMWMKLGNADFSDYKQLNIWVKGDEKAGFTDMFKVQLKNTQGEVGNYMLWGVTSRWQKKMISFEQFKNITDFTEMDEFVIVFEDEVSSPKSGVIYVDDIYVK